MRALRNYMETHNLTPKNLKLSAEDLRDGMRCVLSVYVPEPQFKGQTKERLNNPEVQNQVANALAPCIATLAGYMDPQCVVLGGAVDWRNKALLNYLQARVNEQVQPWYAERSIRIETARVPGPGAASGAALMAFDRIPLTDLDNRRP